MAGPLAVVGTFDTIDQLMLAAADQIGEHEAFVEVATGRRLTFGQWVAAGRSVARQLHALGVRNGDVVAVALSPSIDYAVGCVGALFAGAVVTGVNSRLGPREVAGIFDRCRPAAVIADASFDVPEGHSPLCLAPSAFDLAGAPLTPMPVLVAADPAVIIWTSGTTGVPKGAWFDHRNLEAAVRSAGEMTHAFDRRLGGLPLAHAGYMAKLWEQFAMGLTIVLTPVPWTAQMMLQVLTNERINVGAGVPTQFVKLLELPETATADFSQLRVCLSATAPAAPELVQRIRATLGAPVIVRYAMTESPSITGTDPDDPPDVQFRTVGRPQEGMSVRVVDEAGCEVRAGVVGRVQISGPCVMRGYWRDPLQTAAVLGADGWLTSGDLGRFDAAGNLSLVGRAGDMYIRGGYNVYPLEVENVLVEHPAIAAAAVIGKPANALGEIGVAFVVVEPEAQAPARDELRAWVRDRLADYKAPDEVVVLGALPLTPMAKVDKHALRSS
ncbi:MAG: class I adenylate-forming enzyme family protein [Actinomycetota bacterium]|nr:class I adenylate-forming enzyme family protein [Actinomycetota bacterium]